MGWFNYGKLYCGAYKKRAGRAMVWDMSGASNLPDMHRRLSSGFMIRRRKVDVLDQMPTLQQTILRLIPDGETRKILKKEEPFKAEYVKRGTLPKGTTIGDIAKIRHAIGKAKVPAAVEIAEDILEGGRKVVIFCHHKAVMEMIHEALVDEYGSAVISGGTPAGMRHALVKSFQEDPAFRVLIANAAAQEGITLTAAHDVIMVEPDWVPGNNEQRYSRCWRYGQTETVNVQYLAFKDSLDDRILTANIVKQSRIDQVIDGKVA